jgi:hypothetical protein
MGDSEKVAEKPSDHTYRSSILIKEYITPAELGKNVDILFGYLKAPLDTFYCRNDPTEDEVSEFTRLKIRELLLQDLIAYDQLTAIDIELGMEKHQITAHPLITAKMTRNRLSLQDTADLQDRLDDVESHSAVLPEIVERMKKEYRRLVSKYGDDASKYDRERDRGEFWVRK